MTPYDLLEQLQIYASEKLSNLILPVNTSPSKPKEERCPEVFKMNLPDKKAQTEKVPYLVLQFLNGTDEQQEGQPEYASCRVRIIACAYSDDLSEGPLHVLNMLTRLRTALLRDRIIGKKYELILPLEYLVYPDNPAPYFFGEMMSTWKIPVIRREIEL